MPTDTNPIIESVDALHPRDNGTSDGRVVVETAGEFDHAKVVDSPEFKSWFAGSKVVDAAGNPLPVHHGTGTRGISEFKMPAFFTTDKESASFFFDRGDSPVMMTVFLSIKNPFVVYTRQDAFRFIDLIRRAGFRVRTQEAGDGWEILYEDTKPIRENSSYDGSNLNDWVYVPEVREQLKKDGYDGIVAPDTMANYDIEIFVPLDPSQIKIVSSKKMRPSDDGYEADVTASSDFDLVVKTASSDGEYLSAVESGDMVAVQKMVDDAARDAGYDVGPVWHGTNASFNEFARGKSGHFYEADTGYWFAEDRDLASLYGIPKRFFIRNYKQFGGVYAVQEPEDIKSASPVTHSDDGEVVPLSKRFDSSSTDVRFMESAPVVRTAAGLTVSDKSPDESYLAAVEAGDMTTAQKMVNEAAEKAGFDVVSFHGSEENDFNQFSVQRTADGYFFSPDEATAGYYGPVRKFRLFGKNWADLDDEATFDKIAREAIFNLNEERDADAVKEWAKKLVEYHGHPDVRAFVAELNNRTVEETEKDFDGDWESAVREIDYKDISEDLLDRHPVVKRSIDRHAPLRSPDLEFAREAYGSQEFYMNYQDDFMGAAQDLGYDGVILTDPAGSTGGASVSHVVFRPNAIKLFDAVTKDDEGKIIPLSQRFDAGSDDIRFDETVPVIRTAKTEKQMEDFDLNVIPAGPDAEYFKAVEAGDMASVQRIVDQAARAAGYATRAAHSTNASIFNEFRTGGLGAHFGTPQAAADRTKSLRDFSIGIGRNPGDFRTMDVYLSVSNPLRLPDMASLSDDGSPMPNLSDDDLQNLEDLGKEIPHPRGWENDEDVQLTLLENRIIDIDQFEECRGRDKTELVALLKEMGYDGIIYENSVESPGEDSYIIFDPNQVKLADPVVKDDSGNVIPPSKRFNTGSNDMRFDKTTPVVRTASRLGASLEMRARKEFQQTNSVDSSEYLFADGTGIAVNDDHRIISTVFEGKIPKGYYDKPGSGSGFMLAFMGETGAMRVRMSTDRTLGISFIAPPSRMQVRAVMRTSAREVCVDRYGKHYESLASRRFSMPDEAEALEEFLSSGGSSGNIRTASSNNQEFKEWFGDKVRRAFRNSAIASITIEAPEVGAGWLDGGCRILARALKMLEPDGRIVTIVYNSEGEWQGDHYGYEFKDGGIVDGNGYASDRGAWMNGFISKEAPDRKDMVKVVEGEYPSDLVPTNAALEKVLADAISKVLSGQRVRKTRFAEKNKSMNQNPVFFPCKRFIHMSSDAASLLKNGWDSSKEGTVGGNLYKGISVTLPQYADSWKHIAKLGGTTPVWVTLPAGKKLLDFYETFGSMDASQNESVMDWAIKQGKWRTTKRIQYAIYDEEGEVIGWVDAEPGEEFGISVDGEPHDDMNPETREYDGFASEDNESIFRAYIEQMIPEACGVWYSDQDDPMGLSAPQGIIDIRFADGLKFSPVVSRKASSSERTASSGKIRAYHESGTSIEAFSDEFMGAGDDQYGSGLYFTTSISDAEGYAGLRSHADVPKPGGEDNPTVHEVLLDIRNPLDADYVGRIPRSKIKRIIMESPTLEDSLSNWGDVEFEGRNAVIETAVDTYAHQMNGVPLVRALFGIANDFYRGHERKFNDVVTKVLGYDGVVKDSSDHKLYVAFRADQVEIVGRKPVRKTDSENEVMKKAEVQTGIDGETATDGQDSFDIKVDAESPAANPIPPVQDYRIDHQAPMHGDGAPLHDLTIEGIYPADFYEHPNQYAYSDPLENSAINTVLNYKGRPNALVTIFRSVPKEVPARSWNVGDWVSISRKYVVDHGKAELPPGFRVMQKTVHARDIFTDGNSLLEWGYDPQPRDVKSDDARRERRKELQKERSLLYDYEMDPVTFKGTWTEKATGNKFNSKNLPPLPSQVKASAEGMTKVAGDQMELDLDVKTNPKPVRLEDLELLRQEIADASNGVLDAWQQDDDGFDYDFGSGGACDAIAFEIQGILSNHGYDTSEGGQDGDDHAWVVAYDDEFAFAIDIPPGVYETGAGYSWKKRPGVKVMPEHVQINKTWMESIPVNKNASAEDFGITVTSAEYPRMRQDEMSKVWGGFSDGEVEDIVEKQNSVEYQVLKTFFDNKRSKQPWRLIPAARLKKIWTDYSKMGIVRDEKGLNGIAEIMIENALKLKTNTELCGHSSVDPKDIAENNGFDWNEKIEEQFYRHCPGDRISDYATDPLVTLAAQLSHAASPEQKIHLIDRMLNVVHQRGDIAALFVEGGSRSLTELMVAGTNEEIPAEKKVEPKQTGSEFEKTADTIPETAEELRNLEFDVPNGGHSITPKKSFDWRDEMDEEKGSGESGHETLADLASYPDKWRLENVLGKGWERSFEGLVPASLGLIPDIKAGRKIRIFRATDVGGIFPGAYVTESMPYAKMHGRTQFEGKKWSLYTIDARPDELVSWGDPHEFIYVPRDPPSAHDRMKKGTTPMRTASSDEMKSEEEAILKTVSKFWNSPELENWADEARQQTDQSGVKIGMHGDIGIYLVNGDVVKKESFPDFVEGGNDGVYGKGQTNDFIPPKRVWMDADLNIRDIPYITCHELIERKWLVDKGFTYDPAHEKANAFEMKLRKECHFESQRKTIEFPRVRQPGPGTCGHACLCMVLQYYGVETVISSIQDEATDKENEDGLSPEVIARIAKEYGTKAEVKSGVSIEDVMDLIDDDVPVIFELQAWPKGDKKDFKNDTEDGHYVVAIGYTETHMLFADPSDYFRTFIPLDEIDARWHDVDEGQVNEHTIVVITKKGAKPFNGEKTVRMGNDFSIVVTGKLNLETGVDDAPQSGHLDTQLFPDCAGTKFDRDVVGKNRRRKKRHTKKAERDLDGELISEMNAEYWNKWTPADSSVIGEVSYFEPTGKLEIKTKNHKVYTFRNVPKHEYDSLMEAKSKGKWFAEFCGRYREAQGKLAGHDGIVRTARKSGFPDMSASDIEDFLVRFLGYRDTKNQAGSHHKFEKPGRPMHVEVSYLNGQKVDMGNSGFRGVLEKQLPGWSMPKFRSYWANRKSWLKRSKLVGSDQSEADFHEAYARSKSKSEIADSEPEDSVEESVPFDINLLDRDRINVMMSKVPYLKREFDSTKGYFESDEVYQMLHDIIKASPQLLALYESIDVGSPQEKTAMTKTASKWGKAGSGVMYFCPEDMSVLLLKRSPDVMDGNVWGIPGGAIKGTEGVYEDDELGGEDFDEDVLRESAHKEVEEEMGHLPESEEIGSITLPFGNFKYTTFFRSVKPEQKDAILKANDLNWESTDAQWFHLNELPKDIHPGVSAAIKRNFGVVK